MAEFPDLGEHCFICKTIDFLPLKCYYCDQIFCKDHHTIDGHQCPNCTNDEKRTLTSNHIKILVECSFCKHSVPDIELVYCDKCGLKFCLPHRHSDSHQCDERLVNNGNNDQQNARKLPKKLTALEREAIAPKVKGTKNEALSRKVAIMRLKQTAVGLSSLPINERLYFNVCYRNDCDITSSKQVFLSKEWSVGRCVDWLANHFSVANNNNNVSALQLVLCANDNEICEPFEFSVKLKDLENSGHIGSGDLLFLRYMARNT